MLVRLTIGAALLAVAACAHPGSAPAGCDGAHRRPANPHGSLLTAPDPGATPTPRVPRAPGPDGGRA